MNEPPENVASPDTPLLLFVKGLFVGAANIIPGVSGGTFALVLGIFDRLVGALRNLGPGTAAAAFGLLSGGFRAPARAAFAREWRRADLTFLAIVGMGAAASILALSTPLKWMLENYPGPTLAFFAGLIIPSLAVPWGLMPRRRLRDLAWAVPGAGLTVGLALVFAGAGGGGGGEGLAALLVAAACGALAISAMVLPGISGSFVLLALGQYAAVLEHLEQARSLSAGSVLWLGAFAVGCVGGLLLFARALHWALNRWRSAVLALLVGLVLGSFWVLWPFKDYAQGVEVVGRSGEAKQDVAIASAPNRLPASWGELGVNALALAVGLGGALGVERLGKSGRAASGPDGPVPAGEGG